jgi:hypothetical protein
VGGTLWRGPSGTPAMELLLSGGDGAEEVEEVEVLKHRREGHAMNEERGVRRREANIVQGQQGGESLWPAGLNVNCGPLDFSDHRID